MYRFGGPVYPDSVLEGSAAILAYNSIWWERLFIERPTIAGIAIPVEPRAFRFFYEYCKIVEGDILDHNIDYVEDVLEILEVAVWFDMDPNPAKYYADRLIETGGKLEWSASGEGTMDGATIARAFAIQGAGEYAHVLSRAFCASLPGAYAHWLHWDRSMPL